MCFYFYFLCVYVSNHNEITYFENVDTYRRLRKHIFIHENMCLHLFGVQFVIKRHIIIYLTNFVKVFKFSAICPQYDYFELQFSTILKTIFSHLSSSTFFFFKPHNDIYLFMGNMCMYIYIY